jgi:hypothetical protein
MKKPKPIKQKKKPGSKKSQQPVQAASNPTTPTFSLRRTNGAERQHRDRGHAFGTDRWREICAGN